MYVIELKRFNTGIRSRGACVPRGRLANDLLCHDLTADVKSERLAYATRESEFFPLK